MKNLALAERTIEALIASGVARFFICPGSRSTLLTLAAHASGLPCHVVLDERAAGFMVLGAARAGERACVITSSGTAVCNLLPAAAEAHAAGLSFVALTADRPRRLVGIGANQTIDQPPVLASVARVFDLDVERAELGALGTRVHINVRFEKPLEPERPLAINARPAEVAPVTPVPLPSSVARAIASSSRGLLVVGELPLEARTGAEKFRAELGWPAAVDVTSGLERGVPKVFFRERAFCESLAPDLIVWLGGRLCDPELAAHFDNVKVIQLKHRDQILDPNGIVDETHVIPRLSLSEVKRHPSALWSSVDGLELPPFDDALSEPNVARAVLEAARGVLFLGNSMPVRDADRFRAQALASTLICNRGASGIDGNLATALGAALATGEPVTALVGDLTFLHDASSLAAMVAAKVRARIIVVNNDGGGIFSFLPIHGRAPETFERYFGTPHGRSPTQIATAYGARAREVSTLPELEQVLAQHIDNLEVIEVKTSRDENLAVHDALAERVRERTL